jgi:transposase
LLEVWFWKDSVLDMIHPGFLSAAERLELEPCVRRQHEDHCIARRANATLLLDDGKSCQKISDFLYLADDTIRGWYKSYRQDGWEALAFDGWKRGDICAEFGLDYSHSGCIKLLARLGFEYRKPKPLPRVASAEKQAAFIASYEKLMRGLPADEAVYFADAVHPEFQTKAAFGWVKVGSNPAVLSTAGRGRVNIHGAVDLKTFDAPFVKPLSVDGVSAVQFLTKIEARNPDMRIIHVIWDNAADHKGPDVMSFLSRTSCRIHLIQLPPYCPHLNPFERLWAVLHKYVTHNRYYASQTQFADAILAFIRETILQEWKTFRDRVSDNFRVIKHEKFRVLE